MDLNLDIRTSSFLIVDDEEDIINLLSKHIYSIHPDIKVFSATNADDAEIILDTEEIDAAFVDLGLPGTTGLEFINNAKHSHPFTKFSVITGQENTDYLVRAIELGVSFYFFKPVPKKAFISAAYRMYEQVQVQKFKFKLEEFFISNFGVMPVGDYLKTSLVEQASLLSAAVEQAKLKL